MKAPLILLAIAALALVVATTIIDAHKLFHANADDDCTNWDTKLKTQQGIVCNSLSGTQVNDCCDASTWTHNVTAHHDWPKQATYMENLLDTLIAMPQTCTTTPTARSVVTWLSVQGNVNLTCSFANTWLVFQFQYYILPRPNPRDRVESPWTLGEKCWAAQSLSVAWQDRQRVALQRALAPSGQTVGLLNTMYSSAIPGNFELCNKVAWNCFENVTYNPNKYNGTCPLSIDLFKGGFEYENVRCGQKVKFPYYC